MYSMSHNVFMMCTMLALAVYAQHEDTVVPEMDLASYQEATSYLQQAGQDAW